MKKIFSKQAVFFFVLLMAFAVGVGQARIADAAANIQFNPTAVSLPGGEVVISGNFVNYGDMGATVGGVAISVQISDAYGNPIWADSYNFANVGVYVPAGGSLPHNFHIQNGNCPSYNGQIKWHVSSDLWW